MRRAIGLIMVLVFLLAAGGIVFAQGPVDHVCTSTFTVVGEIQFVSLATEAAFDLDMDTFEAGNPYEFDMSFGVNSDYPDTVLSAVLDVATIGPASLVFEMIDHNNGAVIVVDTEGLTWVLPDDTSQHLGMYGLVTGTGPLPVGEYVRIVTCSLTAS